MPTELSRQYDPGAIEGAIFRRWLAARAFAAAPDARASRYVIMMPLPNVTGALHMGHAMDNVMQDLLIRWHRMRGENTLWMAGTDHAGIATQAVVEKRLLELEGKTRHDLGREALVRRIWEWKDQYQARIVEQQQAMGCSCDWDRQRFTMDEVCARAVRFTFFRMFRDRLIFQGNRLVNWDCHLETAVADDEIVMETVQGHFWRLRYPVIDPGPGEPDHVVVATTRPETMLGDTAVACHPDPAAALAAADAAARERLARAPRKERAALEAELAALEERRRTLLPTLERFAAMARAGRKARLPLLERPIPFILDEWAKPELGSGCVKITPGHDPSDYAVWSRHRDRIGMIHILRPNGTLNENAGPYQGLDRFAARKRVVADLEARGLLDGVEEREIEIGHSDRSKTPIEPFVSRQWFVRMGDIEGGVVCGRGTPRELRVPGLAQAAIDAASGSWHSPSGRTLRFHPDAERYGQIYRSWLSEKRDWCISRQLWWGHRIPVWSAALDAAGLERTLAALGPSLDGADVTAHLVNESGEYHRLEERARLRGRIGLQVCLRDEVADRRIAGTLERSGLTQDPDVLDTWFSSGLWPMSTLGWPDPASAPVLPGQSPLGARAGQPSCLDYYYPGSCLVPGRDIITLWVARMIMMGLYNLGDLPFTEVFVHATILDGKGERMSKSKGNGLDPVDIIAGYGADAMRYVLCEMQTGTQDIRLPVQAVSPYTGTRVDLAKAKRGRGNYTYLCPDTGKEFDVLGSMPGVPAAKLVSERFEIGRNFANKLWNAARFAFLNLEGAEFRPRNRDELREEDRWILSRLATAIDAVHGQLEGYNPSAAVGAAREFFWSEFCDWYVELAKPRLGVPAERALAQQLLAAVLDQALRLLHPVIPFITEALWESLGALVPERGIERPFPRSALLATAAWPERRPAWKDPALEERFRFIADTVRAVRDVRSKYQVPPAARLRAVARASGAQAAALEQCATVLIGTAGLASFEVSSHAQRGPDAATALAGGVEIYLAGVVDPEKERERIAKQVEKLEGQVRGVRSKLENPEFLAKAKPEIVAGERQRLAGLEAELRAAAASLANL